MEAAVPQVLLRQVHLWAWVVFALLLAFIYAVGYDQGLAEQVVDKLGNNYMHEFFHDGRHLLGFPCH